MRWSQFKTLVEGGAKFPEPGVAMATYYMASGNQERGRQAVEWALGAGSDLRQLAIVFDWCQLLMSKEESAKLEAKLRAAELALARVELEAEWERLKQLQPCPSIKELEEYRQRFEKVMARHRESAEQRIQLATDGDLSTSRSNKEVPMPERPRREQRIEEPRQERDGHRHGLDGPSLGR